MEWIFFIGIGLITGFLAGLFGIGGGLILIPLLSYALTRQGLSADTTMHIAIATSLAIILFTSISAVISQVQYAAVNWQVFWWMSISLVIGSLGGSFIGSSLSGMVLRIAIGIFTLAIALELIISTGHKNSKNQNTENPAPKWLFSSGGLVIGIASAIFGIGGGALIVPYLTWCQLPIKKAIGTSSACTIPVAAASTIGYLWTGYGQSDLPWGSLGFIYFPALIPVAVGSMIFARVGVKFSHSLHPVILKRIFAGLLICIAISFLVR